MTLHAMTRVSGPLMRAELANRLEAVAGTDNWNAARRGCLTASRMADAIAFLKPKKDGTLIESEARRKLREVLVAERATGLAIGTYVSAAMQWGIEQQAAATQRYSVETGEIVGGEFFFLHAHIDWFGATPDGLIGDEGLLEIKCPATSTHIRYMSGGTPPPEYVPQMLAQLAVTGRKWVDFVSFDPRIEREDAQFFCVRFEPPAADVERIEAQAEQFLREVDLMAERFVFQSVRAESAALSSEFSRR